MPILDLMKTSVFSGRLSASQVLKQQHELSTKCFLLFIVLVGLLLELRMLFWVLSCEPSMPNGNVSSEVVNGTSSDSEFLNGWYKYWGCVTGTSRAFAAKLFSN